jgi:hypothetical protein
MRVPRVCSPWRLSAMVSHCLTVSCGESERQGETEQLGVMGFLFLVQGGSVPIITAHSASIHRRTGARLTYRRKPDIADAVLLSKVLTGVAAPDRHNRQDGSNG